MKTTWELEREADALLRAAGFKTKRFATRIKFNPNAPGTIRDVQKGETHYEESKAEQTRLEMMKSQQVKQEIKAKKKTDAKLA